MPNELTVLGESHALAVKDYNEDKIHELVDKVRAVVDAHVYDLTTTKGRAAVASLARKISSFKVKLDGHGKDLVAEETAKIARVNVSRKLGRDLLDALRDKARKPLTDWEAAEEARLLLEAEQLALAEAQEEALAEDAVWERERANDRREAEIQAERERLAAERQRLEDEEAARQKAAQEAQEAREREQREKEQREADELERQEREKREALEAEKRAEQAEKDRIAQAERDERMRLQREEEIRQEAETKERNRLLAEEAERKRLAEVEREKREKKARAKRHVEKIHREAEAAISAVIYNDGRERGDPSRALVEAIAAGKIAHISINYL